MLCAVSFAPPAQRIFAPFGTLEMKDLSSVSRLRATFPLFTFFTYRTAKPIISLVRVSSPVFEIARCNFFFYL